MALNIRQHLPGTSIINKPSIIVFLFLLFFSFFFIFLNLFTNLFYIWPIIF
ncbi:hypothetical protein PZA11_007245 [Diplocarpon coronariae]